MATAPTTKTPAPKKESSGSGSGIFATLAIPICIIIGICIYIFVLGDPSHYEGGDSSQAPTDLFGTMHKGGVLVPLVMSYVLMVIVFSIERFIVIGKA